MHNSRTPWLLLACLALTPVGGAGAQPQAKPKAPEAAPAANAPRALPTWVKVSEKDPRLYNIDFPGGSLAEYYSGVTSLPEASSLLTVVVSEHAKDVRLQPLAMRDAVLWSLYVLPGRLLPGVKIEELGGSTIRREDGTEVREAGGYVVGVDPGWAAHAQQAPAATFDLEFPGGTIDAYAEAIRKTWPAANIVIMDGAGKETLPAVNFRSVSLDAVTKTMEIRRRNADGTVTEVFVRGLGMAGGGSQEVYKVEMETTEPGPKALEEARVWSLAVPISNGAKIEDLLSAIEAALAVSEHRATIKYHEATNLLIVRALPSQQNLVDDVIRKVEGTMAARKATPDKAAR